MKPVVHTMWTAPAGETPDVFRLIDMRPSPPDKEKAMVVLHDLKKRTEEGIKPFRNVRRRRHI